MKSGGDGRRGRKFGWEGQGDRKVGSDGGEGDDKDPEGCGVEGVRKPIGLVDRLEAMEEPGTIDKVVNRDRLQYTCTNLCSLDRNCNIYRWIPVYHRYGHRTVIWFVAKNNFCLNDLLYSHR